MAHPPRSDVLVRLTAEEFELVLAALDSHEYWQLGHDLPHDDGLVWLPGDALVPGGGSDAPDPRWPDLEPTSQEAEAIAAIHCVRSLADRLRQAITVTPAARS